MLLSNIFNESFGLFSKAKQLQFYCWHFGRGLDRRQCQELIELLYEDHFERLANRIKSYNHSLTDRRQQIGKILFEHCLTRNRRHQLIQLIESGLVDINVRLDNYGRTLLHRTAYNLDVELVKVLIDHGINIRLRDYAGNTALHIAIQSYRNGALIFGNEPDVVQNLTSIIRHLLEADKNLQNERSNNKRLKSKPTKSISSEESCPSPSSNHESNAQITIDLNPTSNVSSTLSKIEGPTTDNQPPARLDQTKPESSTQTPVSMNKQKSKKPNSHRTINPILLEDFSTNLVDTKNAFGRTALHYCVLVVGEQHLAHFVNLLISYGSDTDAVDSRFKTPLYCLVKRPGVSAVRQKCLAIGHLLDSGCDDLGLAIDPKYFFTEEYIKDVEKNIATILQSKSDAPVDSILDQGTFQRVPSLKHLSRLHIIRKDAEKRRQKQQAHRISLPRTCPAQLNIYLNRKILFQNELF